MQTERERGLTGERERERGLTGQKHVFYIDSETSNDDISN